MRETCAHRRRQLSLFGFLGGLIGGNAAKKGSSKAEQAQLGYLTQAQQAEEAQRAQSRQDLMPWMSGGGAAFARQGDLAGINGNDPQAAAIAQLQASPFYQSQYNNGLEANLQNASATGGIRGGNEVRGLADFGRDTLAQTIQQQFGNLGQLSGQGLAAAGGVVNSGDQLTQLISSILGQQGQVRAGGILTRGGITNGLWQNAGNFLGGDSQGGSSGGGGGLMSLLSSLGAF